ncbi:MAG: riboflavin kinase, partial [Cyanobacteria bacterium J06626_18]
TQQAVAGVMNIGVRPTVDGNTQTIEVHLLNWQGDLYDCTASSPQEAFGTTSKEAFSTTHLPNFHRSTCAFDRRISNCDH